MSLSQVRPGAYEDLCKIDEYVVFTDVAKYLSWIEEVVPQLSSPSMGKLRIRSATFYSYFKFTDLCARGKTTVANGAFAACASICKYALMQVAN